ncbi:alpha/beta hydrolase [Micrococcus luteus]|uniref:alpha/beta fold hydrolase n=1 Tax=Micrococcus TaxID=1269 RepID=UPI000BA5B960|nr:alpha/beta hydrolase [Micrococcus luteus]MCT1869011.1 alpha/beta hydrolase [Micrococcus luteus]MCT1871228.1 alpha/beta hydrolase [Micrococcus luteus]MCT2324814.1 alpha/beta hydrolase [Micrococcus luteus]MCV7611157.1 alpha/beta hydrolase [Micrococcus luteus]MCV7626927.1 alpha/beta hydrolase [Micrococcus luteus]
MIRFLHGIGGRPAHFEPLADALDAAADLAVSPALPGHPGTGASDPDRHRAARPATDADPVLDAARTWAAQAGPVPGLLIGHSTGGVIALRAVADGLVRPRALVVIDSNVPVTDTALAARAAKARLAARSDWRSMLRASLARDLLAPEPWRERILTDLDATPDHPMRELWAAVLAADTRALWAGITVPVLYVRSTRDVHQRDLDAVIAHTTVVDVGLGHWPHVAEPEAVAGVIRRWHTTGVHPTR